MRDSSLCARGGKEGGGGGGGGDGRAGRGGWVGVGGWEGAHHLAIENDYVLVILPYELGAVPRVRCQEDETRCAAAPLLYGREVPTHTQLHGLVAEVVPDTVAKDDHIRLRMSSGKTLAHWQRLAPLWRRQQAFSNILSPWPGSLVQPWAKGADPPPA